MNIEDALHRSICFWFIENIQDDDVSDKSVSYDRKSGYHRKTDYVVLIREVHLLGSLLNW